MNYLNKAQHTTMDLVFDQINSMIGENNSIATLYSNYKYTEASGTNESVNGFYNYGSGVWTPWASMLTKKYDISNINGNIFATGLINGTGTALAVYFNSSNVYLGYEKQGTTSSVQYTQFKLNPPIGTKYVAICNYSTSTYGILYYLKTYIQNQWKYKKIVWLGTSVPFGALASSSYVLEASNKLGFTLVNASVPGQSIHSQDDGSGGVASLTYGSTVLSKAEYIAKGWTIQDTPYPFVPGGSYNNFYRTWENIFSSANADADLFVFDVAPNNVNFDLTDWNLFDKTNWKYSDNSDFSSHRNTFLGALIFLMDKMYSLNPNARMVLLIGSAFNYNLGITAFNLLKSQWNIPIIDIWSKINSNPKSLLQIYSEGGTNPHPSTFAHEKLGNILTNELLLIS